MYKPVPSVADQHIGSRYQPKASNFFKGNFQGFLCTRYCFQHCFICRPSEDAGIEPRTIATTALTVRRSNHSAKSHPPTTLKLDQVIMETFSVYWLHRRTSGRLLKILRFLRKYKRLLWIRNVLIRVRILLFLSVDLNMPTKNQFFPVSFLNCLMLGSGSAQTITVPINIWDARLTQFRIRNSGKTPIETIPYVIYNEQDHFKG